MRIHFAPGFKMSLFTLFFLPVLLWLGAWQLDRASYKQDLELEYLDSMSELAIDISELDKEALGSLENFTKIKAEGRFLDKMFFLDNQTTNGKVGYWVFQPFLTDKSRKNLIVNRGFVAAPFFRDELPSVITPSGRLVIEGTVWPFTGLPPILGEDDWGNDWPKRIQTKDLFRMGKTSGSYPLELRLGPNEEGVLGTLPGLEQLDDSKHLGYALTWFGLAITLIVSYLIFGFQAKREAQRVPQ
mgnify:FL=1